MFTSVLLWGCSDFIVLKYSTQAFEQLTFKLSPLIRMTLTCTPRVLNAVLKITSTNVSAPIFTKEI